MSRGETVQDAIRSGFDRGRKVKGLFLTATLMVRLLPAYGQSMHKTV